MAADAPSAEERLVDLEIRYAHQSRLLTQLDDVVREFASRVELLERKVNALQDGAAAAPVDEKPPHY